MSEGNGDVQFESILIDGTEYTVRREVSDELVRLRKEAVAEYIDKTTTIDPPKNHTIIVTVPGGTSQEFVGQVAQLLKLQFPEHHIAVMPEGLGLHTQEGFRQLLQAGMKMADGIRDATNGRRLRREGADEWDALITAREESDEPDQG